MVELSTPQEQNEKLLSQHSPPHTKAAKEERARYVREQHATLERYVPRREWTRRLQPRGIGLACISLVPSCILLGKNRCRRNLMFTIVTDSYILCGVSPISHADSMSPTETSTLSLTTISTASKNFFTVYNYGCCSYAFFCCLATTTSTWLKKPLAPDLRASLFSRIKKKILFFEKKLHSSPSLSSSYQSFVDLFNHFPLRSIALWKLRLTLLIGTA